MGSVTNRKVLSVTLKMQVKSIFVLIAILAVAFAQDPAPPWLAYSEATNSDIITLLSAKTIVPENPTRDGGFPALWFGIEPNPACNLIQPILKWTGNEWGIWNEYYQWYPGTDHQSKHHKVEAGDTIYAYVAYSHTKKAYQMYIEDQTSGVNGTYLVPVVQNRVYTDAFFVVEHQPSLCDQL